MTTPSVCVPAWPCVYAFRVDRRVSPVAIPHPSRGHENDSHGMQTRRMAQAPWGHRTVQFTCFMSMFRMPSCHVTDTAAPLDRMHGTPPSMSHTHTLERRLHAPNISGDTSSLHHLHLHQTSPLSARRIDAPLQSVGLISLPSDATVTTSIPPLSSPSSPLSSRSGPQLPPGLL